MILGAICTILGILGVAGIFLGSPALVITGAISNLVECGVGFFTGQLKSLTSLISAALIGAVYAAFADISTLMGIAYGLCFESAIMGGLGWIMFFYIYLKEISRQEPLRDAAHSWKIATAALGLALCISLGMGIYFYPKYQKAIDDYTGMRDGYIQQNEQITSLKVTQKNYEKFLASAYGQLHETSDELLDYYDSVALSNSSVIYYGGTIHLANCPSLNSTYYVLSQDYAQQQNAVFCPKCAERYREILNQKSQSYSNFERYRNYTK